MKCLGAGKSEEQQTPLGLKGQMEEAVTGPWKEQLYGEAPRQDLFSEEETQSAHNNQTEESRE